MKHHEAIRSIFEAGAGYARAGDVLSKGIHFSYLTKLIQAGTIKQVSRGLYRWEDIVSWESDLPEIARMIPNGVFCLHTAAEFHRLTTYQPWQHHVAVIRTAKVTLALGEHVKVYYWSAPLMELGMQRTPIGGIEVKVFDLERTVCDLVKFRNKTGKDSMLEAIKNYLKRPDKDISRLLSYARALRVEKIITPYLEGSL